MITITGSNSFIGKNLIAFFNYNKIEYSIIYRKDRKSYKNKTNFYKFSKKQKKKTKVLIHISSPSLVKLYRKKNFKLKEIFSCLETELDNLIALMDFYKKNKVQKFILFSSSTLYGKSKYKKPFSENNELKPTDFYSIIKLALEKLSKKLCKNLIIVRPFQIYGKHDNKKRLVPTLFYAKKNSKIKLQDCLQVTDLLHVEDLCDLILKMSNSKIKNGIFNIGSGKPIKLRDIVKKIHKFKKKKFKYLYKDNKNKIINNYCYSDNYRLRKTFKWKPKISLDEGLKKL